MAKTYNELMTEARGAIPELTPEDAQSKLENGGGPVLLDVREKDEVRQGYIEGAVSIPRGFLEIQVEGTLSDKDRPVIVYCAGGVRSLLAGQTLRDMGYKEVYSMAEGFNGWKNRNLPFTKDFELTTDQLERYSRHFTLSEVGEKGQGKLLQSKVLLLGAGGLGSPTALYLAAAGVGTLGIVDFDVVDRSNLQRQILHRDADVGVPKTESAQKTLTDLNPDVNVIPYQERLSSENVMDIMADYDIVVDGCDNFPTRYLVNDACVFLGKPNVHGSIFQFEGQVTVFDTTSGGPCYRCLYPAPPPPGMAPSCAEAGVLGVLPGAIGVLQAIETIKIILGKGDTLVGRLVLYDALAAKFREMKLRRDPACPVCGDNPEIKELIDYDQFCAGVPAAGQ
jgi:molybdopterin/thiamine biosynthesis adenylyltransferase/rhodanese-related sulfurtransferase